MSPRLDEELRALAAHPPKQTPVEREALALRLQEAIDLIRFPDLHDVTVSLPQRVSLLAAVVWPSEVLLEWSTERARAKLERGLRR